MTEGLFILILSVILIASFMKPSQCQLSYQIILLTLAVDEMTRIRYNLHLLVFKWERFYKRAFC